MVIVSDDDLVSLVTDSDGDAPLGLGLECVVGNREDGAGAVCIRRHGYGIQLQGALSGKIEFRSGG